MTCTVLAVLGARDTETEDRFCLGKLTVHLHISGEFQFSEATGCACVCIHTQQNESWF